MTKKSCIKTIIIFLFLVSLSVALYLRRPKGNSLDFGWNRGLVSNTEREYYYSKMDRIIKDWQDSKRSAERGDRGRLADSYNTYLVIDMDKKALWIEENGQIREEDFCEIPPKVKYNFYYYSPNNNTELSGRTVLKMRGYNTDQMTPEMFFLSFNGTKGHLGIDFSSRNRGGSKGSGSINKPSFNFSSSAINQNNYYGSVLVTEDEYKKYLELIPASDKLKQENENIKAWNRIEKNLYIEIEKQINKVGYKLTTISVEPSPDFSSAQAEFRGRSNSIVKEIFGDSSINAYLKIDYLGNDNWYAKSSVNPKFPSRSVKRRIDLEFLISLNNEITGSERSELIKKGRELQKLNLIPTSRYKAILPNGTTIEFLGICENPSAGKKWWGPDGVSLDIVPYINTKPYGKPREDRNLYEFAWRIIPQSGVSISVEGSNGSYHHAVSDRSGNNLVRGLQVQAYSFDKPRQVTNMKFGFVLNNWNTVLEISDKAGETKFLDKQRIILEPPVIENGQIVIRCYEEYMTRMSEYKTGFGLICYDEEGPETISLGRYEEDVTDHQDTGLTEHKYVLEGFSLSQIVGVCFRYQPYSFIIFKNISLVPGEDFGFEIEVIEPE
ncbi:MAG: hypothetical protein JXA96_07940 [Sedimentisphaerales bacterium]|nr:hypothetical protein [Sedimentisphaerales bacterium]